MGANEHEMTRAEMIRIASQLPYITKADLKYFRNPNTTEVQIQNRMIQRRHDWQ